MKAFTIARHAVPRDEAGLSPLQTLIGADRTPVRILSAPTGAGKSHAFIRAAARGERVLFIVPTRRLAQNLALDAAEALAALEPLLPDAVSLWSSDETARRKQLDPAYRPGAARVRVVRHPDQGRFVVATPEAVALLLLNNTRAGPGTDPFGPADLNQGFTHVVFDEFHSIDPRGFGLYAFLSRLAADWAPLNPDEPLRVTFLSATPIDVAPSLRALGVSPDAIRHAAETVIDDPPPGPALDTIRVLHGDVSVRLAPEPDMVALLDAHAADIRACIDGGRQLVVILNSLAELYTKRTDLAALFDRLGVPPARRLAINSIDDSAQPGMDGLFTVGRGADPRDFDVLLATSSVEMGVTFRAGMLAMDPGHDALSFVQRIGRVARGDEPGMVLVRHDPARDGRRPWLREFLGGLAEEGPRLTASRFNALALRSVRERFEADPAALANDAPTTFRSMPERAVWAACLFWLAFMHGRPRFMAGERRVLGRPPGKVFRLKGWLETVRGRPGARDCWSDWVEAFLRQACTLRNIAARVSVQEPGGGSRTIPADFLDRFPVLASFPLVFDEKGLGVLHLDRPLGAVMAGLEQQWGEPRCAVLLPTGQDYEFPVREAVASACRAIRREIDGSRRTQAERDRLAAAAELIGVTHLVPPAHVPAPAVGAAIA